jgi:hypothetical protein
VLTSRREDQNKDNNIGIFSAYYASWRVKEKYWLVENHIWSVIAICRLIRAMSKWGFICSSIEIIGWSIG